MLVFSDISVYRIPMKDSRYPHVTSYRDRHGKTRHRFRRSGFLGYSFRAAYGTPQFDEEYEKAQQDREPTTHSIRTRAMALRRRQRQAGTDLARQDEERVYIIGGRYYGPVKIGRTTDLQSRLVRLQTGNPSTLRVLFSCAGGAEREAALHQRFSHLKLRGEWFKRAPEMVAFLRSGGEPAVGEPLEITSNAL